MARTYGNKAGTGKSGDATPSTKVNRSPAGWCWLQVRKKELALFIIPTLISSKERVFIPTQDPSMVNACITRPTGSGLNDEAKLRNIYDLLEAEPHLSARAAITRTNIDDEATICRLERKLLRREKERAAAVGSLLAKPFDVGNVHSGDGGWPQVEVPSRDGSRFHVRQTCIRQLPSLIVINGKDDLQILRSLGHPLVEAIHLLHGVYDWNDASYRACCTRLGFDPDLHRPEFFYGTWVAGAEAWTDLCRRHRTTDRFARLERPEPGTHGRDPLWDVVDDSDAFWECGPGNFSPERLSQLHRKHAGSPQTASVQTARDARHAFERVDWSRQAVPQSVYFMVTAAGEGKSYTPLFLDRKDAPTCWHYPNLAFPPAPNDLIERRILLQMESTSTTLVLSEAEIRNFEAGGDREHWARFHGAKNSRLHVLWNALTASDLSMTDRIAQEIVRVGYAGYLLRHAGRWVDSESKLSFETREPIQASKPRSFWRNATVNLGWIWRHFTSAPSRAGAEYAFAIDSTLYFGAGSCFMTNDYSGVRVRSEDKYFTYAGRKVRLSVNLVPWGRLGYIPDIGNRRFEMTDFKTGAPIELDLAVEILGSTVKACTDDAIRRKIDRLASKSAFRFLLGLTAVLLYLLIAR